MKYLKLLNLQLLTLTLISNYSLAETKNNEAQPPKAATQYTIENNKALQSYLPFDDMSDFKNAQKGFIATIESGVIQGDNDRVAYDMKQFDFLEKAAPDTANPSLWRQGQLNRIHGLFKVRDDIYQIRSYDLSNMTLIKGKTGWIVIDPLLTPPTAKAGMQLVEKHLGKFPVSAVIITHSHIDHFGGIRGVVDEADVTSGKIPIYAPHGFYDSAISENIMAGNAMSRRASYMFGNLLPKNATGTIGSGLGQTTSVGLPGILQATDSISSLTGEFRNIDGLNVEFIYTPEAEAPAEMMFYFHDLKAFCQAENINRNFHNLYTLRGAKVRNGQKWSQYIDKAIEKWGADVEYSFGTHHWPTWGNDDIIDFWGKQRDLYRFVHDQTVRLANTGLTPKEIAEVLKLPDSLGKEFYNRGYYGSVSHNIKAQYQLYYGWFDGNPANLNRLPPEQSSKKYLRYMGGSGNVLSMAKQAYAEGDYRWVAEVVNHIVFAEPGNTEAKNLQADALEQLGFQAESGPWRNFYLGGAKELREGVKPAGVDQSAGIDIAQAMTIPMFFDALAVKTNPEDAEGEYLEFNFHFTDINEKYSLVLENSVLHYVANKQTDTADARLSISKKNMIRMALGEVSPTGLVTQGDLKISGNLFKVIKLFSLQENPDPWFNIVTP